MTKIIRFFIILLFINNTYGAFNKTGNLAAQSLTFFEPGAYDGQQRQFLSLSASLQLTAISDDRNHLFTFKPFARLENHQSGRTHADIRELAYTYSNNKLQVNTGFSHVSWGVLESKNIVDIINQTDILETFTSDSKYGQPMVHLSYQSQYGLFEFFELPYFREREFTAIPGRTRLPLEIADNSKYDVSNQQWHQDFAARWSHTFEQLDIALSSFSGLRREPDFVLPSFPPFQYIQAYYPKINQHAAELSYTFEKIRFKSEIAYVNAKAIDNYYSYGVGLEHTSHAILKSRIDATFFLEYLRDKRKNTEILANDLFVGTRLNFNNINTTLIEIGLYKDFRFSDSYFIIQAGRRFAEKWIVACEALFLIDIDTSSPVQPYAKDSHLQLTFSRFF